MKKYTYYFADGTKSTIEVEDKWYDILKEMDEAERKGKYNYDRHNKSASLFDYEGDAFVDDKADPFENLMREKQREQLDAARHAYGLPARTVRSLFCGRQKGHGDSRGAGRMSSGSKRPDRADQKKIAKIFGIDHSETRFSSLNSEGTSKGG